MAEQNLKYRRVLLKLSGEALAGDAHRGLNFEIIGRVCEVIRRCVADGLQIGIVVGCGNFWRGVKDGGERMQKKICSILIQGINTGKIILFNVAVVNKDPHSF